MANEGDALALYRAMLSDLQYKLKNPAPQPGPRQPGDPVLRFPNEPWLGYVPDPRVQHPTLKEKYEFHVPQEEGYYEKRPEGGTGLVVPDRPPFKAPPNERVSRSGGFAPQEPSHEETAAALENLRIENRRAQVAALSPFDRERLEMRTMYVAPRPSELTSAERAARDEQMLKSLRQQQSSASGGFAPNEPPRRVDPAEQQMQDLVRRYKALNKPGDLI